MKPVSVIIAAHNRPEFLAEALASVNAQNHAAAEIIVVDDGSNPPVETAALAALHGPSVRVLRNATAMGVAFSRNRGVEAATGVYVIHLDDDDLLAPEAIAEAYSLLSSDPQLELVFLGVRGFGSRAEHFNSAQSEAVDRVRVLGQGQESLPWIVYFGRELGSALLQTVPIAFQRVMLTREKWKAVSTLRWRAYRVDPAIATDEDAKRALTGQLRDAEWAIYAAAICRNTALINRPLYLQRCEDQGYSSRAENEELHMRQNLMIKYRLHEAAASLPELGSWRKPIRESLASVEFAIAYRRYLLADRAASWQHLLRAIRLDPRFLYLRFALRMWLPRRQ